MNLQTIIITISILSFFIVLFWIIYIIRRGGGSFYITKKLNGETSLRFNFNLARDITMASLLFAGYVFLLGNFACFILIEEWVFGLATAKVTLITVSVFTTFYILDYVYNFAKDKSEKRVHIREAKPKQKREPEPS